MIQKTSPQFLPASAVSALSEMAKLRSVRGRPSYTVGICLLPISQVTDTHSYTEITQGFSPWFFHSLKPLFHQHLKFITQVQKRKAFNKTSVMNCPHEKQMNKWVAERAMHSGSAGRGKLFDFIVPLLSSSGKWESQ